MTWGGASIIPWRKNRFEQDDVSRPENTTKLGKVLAGAFLIAGLLGIAWVARTAEDIQRNGDLALVSFTQEFEMEGGRCILDASAALQNDGDEPLEVTRIRMVGYSGPDLGTDHPALAEPVSLGVDGVEVVAFEVDIGASCPLPQLFIAAWVEVEWHRADEPDRLRTRSLSIA